VDLAGREFETRCLAEQLGCEVRRDQATLEWRWTRNPIPGAAPLKQRLPVDHHDRYTIWDLRFGLERWVRSPRSSGRWTIEEVEAWLAGQEPNGPCPSTRGRRPCIAVGGLGHRSPHAWASPTADTAPVRGRGTRKRTPGYDLIVG
jgi:hypothetical protein